MILIVPNLLKFVVEVLITFGVDPMIEGYWSILIGLVLQTVWFKDAVVVNGQVGYDGESETVDSDGCLQETPLICLELVD